MKYCTYCGSELPEEVKFCPNCGKPIVSDNYDASPAYRPEAVNNSYPANNACCPPTYLVFSIVVTLLCCIPFGIIGIVNAANVTSRFNAGDIQGASKASRNARLWSTIALCCGIIGSIIYILLVILGVVIDNNPFYTA